MVDLVGNLDMMFQYLSGQTVWWGMVVLASAATVEYLVPPFPGDTVILAGAILIPQAGWPVSAVFGAVLAGTAVGITVDWRVGVWLANSADRDTWLHKWLADDRVAPKLEKLDRQFEKWGSIYISLNRFIPAFRALFFLAAGHSGLKLWKVLLFGSLSAAIYNAALLGLGYAVGYKLDRIAAIVDTYSRWFWVALGVLIVAWLAKKTYEWYASR